MQILKLQHEVHMCRKSFDDPLDRLSETIVAAVQVG